MSDANLLNAMFGRCLGATGSQPAGFFNPWTLIDVGRSGRLDNGTES